MKRVLLLSMAIIGILSADESLFRAGENDIILSSTIIKLVDGLSIGINGQRIAMMLKVRKEVIRILFGIANESGQLVGLYQYNGNYYTARELTLLEAECRENGDKATLEALRPVLQHTKQEFMAKIKPFMASARGAKRQMLLLIEESCKKRKRFDSILLRWGAAKEEDEAKQFDKDIVDFKIFDTFCTDLVHFIEDVIRSCPKAVAQFKQLVEQQAGHKQ